MLSYLCLPARQPTRRASDDGTDDHNLLHVLDDDNASLSPAALSPEACLVVCRIAEKTLKRERNKPQEGGKPFHGLDLAPLLDVCSTFTEVVPASQLVGSVSASTTGATTSNRLLASAPLRTVKAILQALAASLGPAVRKFTAGMSPNSPAMGLLNGYLGSSSSVVVKSTATVAATSQAPQISKTPQMVPPVSAPEAPAVQVAVPASMQPACDPPVASDAISEDTTLKAPALSLAAQLNAIFARVRDPDATDAAIVELYDFQQAHPDEPMDHLFATMSPFFREHVKSLLSQTANKRAAEKKIGTAATDRAVADACDNQEAAAAANRTSKKSATAISMESIRARLSKVNISSNTTVAASRGSSTSVPATAGGGAGAAVASSSSSSLAAFKKRLAGLR